jgi:hypothetical protein
MSQTIPQRTANYIKRHSASLGTFLAAYGVFYLYSVIRTGWVPTDGFNQVHRLESLALYPPILNPYVIPAFFLTSLPALLLGTAILCMYSIKILRSTVTAVSEYVAILLTVFGFAYTVLGAWPLQATLDFPWDWQKQIMGYGAVFAWGLYGLSVVVFGVGAFSLFVHSRDYHRRHSELIDGEY